MKREYLVTERTECDVCIKGFVNLNEEQKALLLSGATVIPISVRPSEPFPNLTCLVCRGTGHHDVDVPLLDVLKRLRWGLEGDADGNFQWGIVTNVEVMDE